MLVVEVEAAEAVVHKDATQMPSVSATLNSTQQLSTHFSLLKYLTVSQLSSASVTRADLALSVVFMSRRKLPRHSVIKMVRGR